MLLKIDKYGILDLDRGCYIVWIDLDERLHYLDDRIEKLNEWFAKHPIDIEDNKNWDGIS